MAFNVPTFRSKLIADGARQNLFEITLPFPAVSGAASQTQYLAFMCKAASLPPEEIGVVPVPYFGRQIKVPGNRTFPEWSMTVINDEGFLLRNAFEKWSNALDGHVGNLRNPAALIGPNGYAVDITINQYGKTGNQIMQYVLRNAWPSAVSPQDLAWDANDQIQEFQVTIQYDYWENVNTV